jgi:hypothetical protein
MVLAKPAKYRKISKAQGMAACVILEFGCGVIAEPVFLRRVPMKERTVTHSLIIALLFNVLLLSAGCGGNSGFSPGFSPAVSIQKKQNLYYEVVMNYTGRTHKEMGKALAREILRTVPDYEFTADSLLEDQFTLLLKHYPEPTFATALNRARAILQNVPQEYVDEIQGMQEVFNYGIDVLGDGRVSANELLVLQLFQDVLRPTQCSASAAFGVSSATGKTVVGRNLDWDALPRNDISKLHTVTTMKNGDKTICLVHFLGTLSPTSLFNKHKVFGALLDAETGAPYPADLSTKRSYPFDLRYALENNATLQGAADFMISKDYAFNHLVFLSDENTAKVLEENIGSLGRGLRSSDSPLRPGVTWGIPDAVATVNDFRLPGNFYVEDDPSDNNRWNSFRNLYTAQLSRGKIDVEKMKGIAGYFGTDGNAYTSGALFLSNTIVTVQSIILRMDTMEMWIHFSPVGTGLAPLNPTYIRVHHPLETL